MSAKAIRAALEAYLNTMTPAVSIAAENMNFTPVSGTPFQRINLLRANPENPTIGATHYRELGVFQVSLHYPMNAGPSPAETRAELVRAHFKRGTTLTNSGITVTIDGTPTIASGFVDGDRWVVPVSIPYWANIFI